MGAAAAVAIMRMKERQLVDDFRAVGAVSPSTAQSYAAMGFGEARAVKRLHDRAVIREAAPDLYYLDEEVWIAVCAGVAGSSSALFSPSSSSVSRWGSSSGEACC
jgi:hypothetical protein